MCGNAGIAGVSPKSGAAAHQVTTGSILAFLRPTGCQALKARFSASNRFSLRRRRPFARSIKLESRFVILFQRRILAFLAQIAVADREDVELVSHETAERVLRRTHDGLAAHIEARIHEDRTASFPLERGEQRVIAWIGV